MTCKECGYEGNAYHAGSCQRCGESLLHHDSPHDQAATGHYAPDQAGLTVLDSQSRTILQDDAISRNCPHCRYLLQVGSLVCPQCGTKLGAGLSNMSRHLDSATDLPSANTADRPELRAPTSRFHLTSDKTDHLPGQPLPGFRLEPLSAAERDNMGLSREPKTGLNGIDPKGEGQAPDFHFRIYRDAASGDWKLENTGAGQGLFVQVQGTVTLQPDTVIRVGGSAMYRFHPED